MFTNLFTASSISKLQAVFDSTLIDIKSFILSLHIVERKKPFLYFLGQEALIKSYFVLSNVKIIKNNLRVSIK
jgi:hypothetical protein